jgi:DNA primase
MPPVQNAPEEIKSRLSVVDVLSGYIRLEKAGAHYKANCPFHQERTPSFMVNEERNMWHCFGCGKGGDIFAFVMEIEGIGFREALVLLADKAGVELPAYGNREQNAEARDEKERLYAILDYALRFYEKQLWEGPGKKKILPYLKERGLSEESIKTFRLGYAPEGWEHLAEFLGSRGYTAPELEKAGLALKRDSGRGVYDRFRDRIMFPVFDILGRPIGFSARLAPGGNEEQAKYLNTPETALYHKSRALYGLAQAKQAMKRAGATVVVEGNMDVIALYQAGIQNTVAVSGTALTDEQLSLMKRYGKDLSLFFDMDGAGQKAARKSAELALAREFSVKVVALPSGKDAADLGREDPEALREAALSAIPAPEYFLSTLLASHDTGSAEGKRAITEAYAPLLLSIKNPIEQGYYVKEFAARLGVEEKTLVALLNQAKASAPHSQEEAAPRSAAAPILLGNRAERLREEVIALMYADKGAREEGLKEMKPAVKDYLSGHPLFFFLVQSAGHDPLSLIEETEPKALATKLVFRVFENPDLASLSDEEKSARLAELFREYLGALERELTHAEALRRLERDLRSAKEKGDRETERRLLAEFAKITRGEGAA